MVFWRPRKWIVEFTVFESLLNGSCCVFSSFPDDDGGAKESCASAFIFIKMA